jgi:hypothetical protein
VSQGWLTGSVQRWKTGERRVTCETRPISCRVEDAPAEVAELVAWLTRPEEFHPQFDW